MAQRRQNLIAKVYANPRFRGRRVVIIHGKAFPTPGGTGGFEKLKRLLERYPEDTPTVVYVPKAETLILVL